MSKKSSNGIVGGDIRRSVIAADKALTPKPIAGKLVVKKVFT